MSGPRPVALEAAVHMLVGLLERGDGEVSAATLEREREACGISARTMNRARAQLGCLSIRRGDRWIVTQPREETPL